MPPRPPRPLVVAHRGDSAHFPENTFPAFDAALAAGADGIELDVQATRDFRVVVLHDPSMYRILGRRGKVSETSFATIAALDAGRRFAPDLGPVPVPTLDGILARYHGRTHLFVELKVHGRRTLVDDFVDAVTALLPPPGSLRSLWVIGFTAEAARRMKSTRPDVPVALSLSAMPQTARALQRRAAPFDGIVCPARRSLGEALHAAGKWLLCYRCDRPAAVRTALAAGADVLMADDPALLRRRTEGWRPASGTASPPSGEPLPG